MAGEKTVRDLLIGIEEYPHISSERPLREAIAMLREYTCGPEEHLLYAEILVVDPEGRLTGRLTLRGILAGLSPKLFAPPGGKQFEGREDDFPNLTILWEDHFLKTCPAAAGRPVGEFMTPIAGGLKPTDSFLKALYVMIRRDERCLPVIEGGRILGMVRLKELFDAACEICSL